MENLRDNLSIIYMSCDRYKSLWRGFFTLLDRYWPECDLNIILDSESEHFSYGRLNISEPLFCGNGVPWSSRLLMSLEKAETPFVLLMMDDFYIKSPVDIHEIEKCVRRMKENSKVKGFVLTSEPGPNKSVSKYDRFEQRGRFATYRITAAMGIWRVDYLKKIIRRTESPWQFEINGSFRSSIYGGILYSKKEDTAPIVDTDHGFLVIRGKQNRELVDYFNKVEDLNLNLDFDFIENGNIVIKKNMAHYLRLVKYLFSMVWSLFKK